MIWGRTSWHTPVITAFWKIVDQERQVMTEETSQGLRTLAALSEDLGSIPSIRTVAYKDV